MQQCLQSMAGGSPVRALPPQPADTSHGRHRALLLIRDRPARTRSPDVWRRALDRLLMPAAQVEGVDHHLADPALPRAAELAGAFVLVLPPLGNLSNPLYSVHPRRNDRFLMAQPGLKALYPEVDFASFAFTGHALTTLAATCPERFVQVRQCLANVWLARMRRLLGLLPARGVLVELAPPPWLPLPVITGNGHPRLGIDADDRALGAEALGRALQRWS